MVFKILLNRSTYSCCKDVRFPSSFGNGPKKLFELKLLQNKKKNIKVNFVAIEGLILKQKYLIKKCRYELNRESNLVKLPSSEGTAPVRLFMPRLLSKLSKQKDISDGSSSFTYKRDLDSDMN